MKRILPTLWPGELSFLAFGKDIVYPLLKNYLDQIIPFKYARVERDAWWFLFQNTLIKHH